MRYNDSKLKYSSSWVLLVFFLFSGSVVAAEKERELDIQEFIEIAADKDTVFEEILIDELTLKYQKYLKLPAGDIVAAVKQEYEFFKDPIRDEPNTSVSLSKLFPYLGTKVDARYKVTPSINSTVSSSEVSFSLTQPIAENAFGHATRLRDKIVGIEIDLARHQITEAYEDYLAFITLRFYEWYEAYQNLSIARSSYQQNEKLVLNMKKRQENRIALPLDVHKIKLQFLAKKEKLVDLEEKYQNKLTEIKRIIRHTSEETLIPAEPAARPFSEDAFENKFLKFKTDSRTYAVLRMLEEKSSLDVSKNANDLLPSINLLVGYDIEGIESNVKNDKRRFSAGISVEWPFPDQVEKAEKEIAVIKNKKTALSTNNIHHQLYTNIRNLHQEIKREEKLNTIAKEKFQLAKAILKDETENYSFGKVTLNDYIDAVNVLDNNRFNVIFHDVLYKKLIIDYLRLTDDLISRNKIKPIE